MTATVSHPLTAESDDRSTSSSPRLSLAATGSAPALLDGAWWPRSRDLAAELPLLTAVLDPGGGSPGSRFLVIPPRTTPDSAARLMAAASDPLGTSTASRLMADETRSRTEYEADRGVEAVWDSEGGHEARDPAAGPGIPGGTASVPYQPKGR
ncbi:DUF5994 family protein [Streptomyces coeruleorubidus]|uniref:DUF5994 family protein n=1 Tax=Streptomyces coeruleorubidus TaxID=116188 RepID=UPI0036F930C6